jgi:hypothetical protein
MSEPTPRGDYSNLEELTISDLGGEALRPFKPPITNFSVSILVEVVPPRVTCHERHIVLQESMEANVATSSRSPHTPLTISTTEGIYTRNPPSLVWTTTVLTPSTSGRDLIPSLVETTTPSHRVQRALHFHMGCSTLIQTLSLPTPPYRPWVWGKGYQMLPCKGPWEEPHPPITLFLTVGVIYLLRPPRSTVLSSHSSGQTQTTTCLEKAV